MAAETVVRARIDLETKTAAKEALAAMGLSVSDFIRIALVRVAKDRAVPFDVKVPNALTEKTLLDSENGRDVHKARDSEELFRQLGI